MSNEPLSRCRAFQSAHVVLERQGREDSEKEALSAPIPAQRFVVNLKVVVNSGGKFVKLNPLASPRINLY